MSVFRRLTILVVAAAGAPGPSQPSEFVDLLLKKPVTVSGVTVDSSGNPIPGVHVDHLARKGTVAVQEYSVRSDESGRFSATTIAPTIVFRKNGFGSVFVRISSPQMALRIVMKPAPAPFVVPACPAMPGCGEIGLLCLPQVRGLEAGKVVVDGDAFERSFALYSASGYSEMLHGAGPSWGGPYPRSSDVWASIEYKERALKGPGIQGILANGRTVDGKLWRYLGITGESVFYFGLHADAAAMMDRAMDSVCVVHK